MKDYDYRSILSTRRVRMSSNVRRIKIDEFYSDRSRIIYSSSFRRLQQKAQVFSLEPNSSVRTRMTHSLEVSDLGRALANKIAQCLNNMAIISVREMPILVSIVENACLLHDIGNPPFGHFGETAIQEWAKDSLVDLAKESGISVNNIFRLLITDFVEFDGNPQGFRILTKLHCDQDKYSLNLTFGTLLCALKYSRAAGESKDDGIMKKAGYFQSEKELVEGIFEELGLPIHSRYPLTYIMEAADDIAYCMSDIADGIEKKIITLNDFRNEFETIWSNKYGYDKCPVSIPDKIDSFSLSISVPWSKMAIEEAANFYVNNHNEVFLGKAKQIIPDTGMGRVLKTIKQVSRNTLYKSIYAESIEITGYAVITGILRHYQRLLLLSYNDFQSLIDELDLEYLSIERRLFNRLGKRYIRAYQYALYELNRSEQDYYIKEWWLRIHLLVDHISGMTDDYALETYQMLEGINLLKCY